MNNLDQARYFLNEEVEKRSTFEQLRDYGITEWTIQQDGSIDVKGNVDLSEKGLTKIPFRFGKVTGNFSCDNNQLKTLEGSPSSIGGDFNCSKNTKKFTKANVRKVCKVRGNINV